MEVQAIYDRDANRLILPGDIRFRHPKVPVRVMIPDQEIIEDNEQGGVVYSESRTDQNLQEILSLLGSDWEYIDNGRTGKDRFAEALTVSERYKT
jgi:hypothetical protein